LYYFYALKYIWRPRSVWKYSGVITFPGLVRFWYRQIWTKDWKHTAVQQILHSNECVSLSIDSVHLDNKYKKLYKLRFCPLRQQETKSLQIYWNYLACCNLLFGLLTRIVFFMLWNIHYGKKIKATIVEDLKAQLGLQMKFKRKKCSKLRIRKKIEKNLLYHLG